MPIRYLVPVEEAQILPLGMAPRLTHLDGAVLGVLDNGKPRARDLLQYVVDLLQTRHRLGRVIWYQKVSPSNNAPSEQLDVLARLCDFFITGVGD